MPNHVNCIGLFMIDWNALENATGKGQEDEDFLNSRLEALRVGNLCDKACSGVDESNEAARDHWGTKWGAYQVNVTRLGGDCFPVIVDFNSAWSAPNAGAMKAINEYLHRECFLVNHRWVKCDPYDNSVADIEVLK